MLLDEFDILVSNYVGILSQCSLAAGRLTSGLKSITLIVSGGLVAHAIIFLWLLLNYRLSLCSCDVVLFHVDLIDELVTLESLYPFQLNCFIVSSCSVTSGVLGILYPLLMAALLGIGDGVLMTQLNALLGLLFKHDTVLIITNEHIYIYI